MLKIINTIHHWIQLHFDSLVILGGGLTGALWKVQLHQVMVDLCTLQNFEGLIKVGLKAFIGAAVAWGFKRTCNYLTKKKIKRK